MHPELQGSRLWRKNRESPSAEAFKRKSAQGDASASEKESQKSGSGSPHEELGKSHGTNVAAQGPL